MPNLQTEFEQEIAKVIVEALKLEVLPADIDPQAPLFGDDGLGLDSIDMLELAFALSKQYGVSIKSGDSKNIEIFTSLATLSEYISQHKEA